MIYVLDAHALVWYLEDNSKLSIAAEQAIDDSTSQLVVPVIALAEIRHLHSRGKVMSSAAEVRAMIASTRNGIIWPFDEHILDLMPPGLEMHDAMIVATALYVEAARNDPVSVVTIDRRITASGLVDICW